MQTDIKILRTETAPAIGGRGNERAPTIGQLHAPTQRQRVFEHGMSGFSQWNELRRQAMRCRSLEVVRVACIAGQIVIRIECGLNRRRDRQMKCHW